MLTKEQLMKPRYKVIADYPKSLYNVGDILNGGWRSEDLIYCDHNGPRWRHYPHLFKPLQWWEERKPEEMPEYVRVKNNPPFKISIGLDISEAGSAWMCEKSPDGLRHRIDLRKCQPTTESEYTAYQMTRFEKCMNCDEQFDINHAGCFCPKCYIEPAYQSSSNKK